MFFFINKIPKDTHDFEFLERCKDNIQLKFCNIEKTSPSTFLLINPQGNNLEVMMDDQYVLMEWFLDLKDFISIHKKEMKEFNDLSMVKKKKITLTPTLFKSTI